MQKFNFDHQLKEIINTRELTELRFWNNDESFKVAYIINVNEDYITAIEVSPEATFDGVCIYRREDLCLLKEKTLYLSEWGKKVKSAEIFSQAEKYSSQITDFTFKGFIRAFNNSKTPVEVTFENENNIVGKITGFDDNTLKLIELDEKLANEVGTCYVTLEQVFKLAVSVGYFF